MKRVILAMGTVLVLGCVEQPSRPSVSKPPRATVLDELAAAVEGALNTKRVEEGRLVQYAVEKRRLVSRLMPIDTELDWADLHAMAIEGYVTERDPEAAKNLCVGAGPGIHGGRGGLASQETPRFIHRKTERKTERAERQGRKSQGQKSQTKHFRRQHAPQAEVWRWQKIQ